MARVTRRIIAATHPEPSKYAYFACYVDGELAEVRQVALALTQEIVVLTQEGWKPLTHSEYIACRRAQKAARRAAREQHSIQGERAPHANTTGTQTYSG